MYTPCIHVHLCTHTMHLQSFKLENKATGAYLYAGVLDFTSPIPEQAFIPQWMMEHLGASDGMLLASAYMYIEYIHVHLM